MYATSFLVAADAGTMMTGHLPALHAPIVLVTRSVGARVALGVGKAVGPSTSSPPVTRPCVPVETIIVDLLGT